MLRFAASSLSLIVGASAALPSTAWAQRETATMVRLSPEIGGECLGCQLSGRMLRGWRMAGVSFERADLSKSTLTRAVLADARLQGANFTNVEAQEANFASATLADATFILADAQRANFENANLRNVNFTLARLDGARFDGADLRGAYFDRASIAGADLSGAVGLTQRQLEFACGDAETALPAGLAVDDCR